MTHRFLLLIFVLAGCSSFQSNQSSEKSSEKEIHPLILISIDGFRPDYLETIETPNLRELAAGGVLAESMIPVFPSLTFPNHYSLVTGLYAENTGLISNSMYDPVMDASFSLGNRAAVSDGRWYDGEPIWVTAEKQGMRSAAMFWPGSEAEIKGIRPTRWMQYDGRIPDISRVDSVINWLTLNDETRPGFVTLYFSKVDSYGHNYGVGSDSVKAAVREIDAVIGYLISELKRTEIWPNVNIIITSDHGMTNLSTERIIFLDDLISLSDARVITYSAATMIQPNDGKLNEVFTALKASENDLAYDVYLKQDIPDRFRLKNNHRVPEIVMIAKNGWSITSRSFFESRGIIAGAHGFDNLHPDMAALFMATGAGIKKNMTIDPFESVHVYDLMCALMGLKPAENDGDIDVLKKILQ